MRARAAIGFALCLMLTAAGACRHRKAADVPGDPSMGYDLGSSDPDKRKDAAEKLRDNDGPPADAVPQLLKALERETDPDAKEEMLVTLGGSGTPEAKAALEAHLNDPDRHARKGAEKGLERWGKKTGRSTEALAKIAQLKSPEAGVRRDAAEDLGKHDGPPADAVAPLVEAAKKEQNAKTLQTMLITLGGSGAPEAKTVLDVYLEDRDDDIRRAAQKGLKKWRGKNGQSVRRDVETAAAPAPPPTATPSAAPAAPPPPPDGCAQFKEICAADPFALDKCRADMKPLSLPQQQVWADCVNASPLACQKAHDACLPKAKKAK